MLSLHYTTQHSTLTTIWLLTVQLLSYLSALLSVHKKTIKPHSEYKASEWKDATYKRTELFLRITVHSYLFLFYVFFYFFIVLDNSTAVRNSVKKFLYTYTKNEIYSTLLFTVLAAMPYQKYQILSIPYI